MLCKPRPRDMASLQGRDATCVLVAVLFAAAVLFAVVMLLAVLFFTVLEVKVDDCRCRPLVGYDNLTQRRSIHSLTDVCFYWQ